MEWYSPVDNGETKDLFNCDKSGLYTNGTKTHSPLLTFSQYRQRQLSKSLTHDTPNSLNVDNTFDNSRIYNTDKLSGNFGSSHTYKCRPGFNSDCTWNSGANKLSSYGNDTSYLNGQDYSFLSPAKQFNHRPHYNSNHGSIYGPNYGSSYENNHGCEYKSPICDYKQTRDLRTSDFGYKCSYNNYKSTSYDSKPTQYDYKPTQYDYKPSQHGCKSGFGYKSGYYGDRTSGSDCINYIPAYDAKMSKITKIPMYNNVTVPSFPTYDSHYLQNSLEYSSPIYKRKALSSHYQYKSPTNHYGDGIFNSQYNEHGINGSWNSNKIDTEFDNFKYNPNTPGSDSIKRPHSDTRLFSASPSKHERSERSEILKSNDTQIDSSNKWTKRHKIGSDLFDRTPNRIGKSTGYFNHDSTKYVSSPFDFDNVGLFDSTPKRNRSLLSTPVKPWNMNSMLKY